MPAEQPGTHPTDAGTSSPEQTDTELPKVSCLVVTADRGALLRRSVRCYLDQSWPNKELVVVDDGEEDLTELLQMVPGEELNYVKLEKNPENTLGKLRNISLEEASGDFLAQWDDDDWYHPERLAVQARNLMQGHDACCLSGALMHLMEEPYLQHPYVGYLSEGIPGSIMHRNDGEIRYPHTRRAEDTVYLKAWKRKRYRQLSDRYSYLMIRCFHGDNTWERDHFVRRIRNSPLRLLQYVWYAGLRNDLFKHPVFRLSPDEKEAFHSFYEDSRKAGLTPPSS